MDKKVQNLVDEIVASISKKEMVMLCGAGISKDSGIPSVSEFMPYMLSKLGISEAEAHHLLASDFQFEAFVQILQEAEPIEFLINIFDARQPNVNHRFLAKLMASGYLRAVYTTNFDPLIELALKMEGEELNGECEHVISKCMEKAATSTVSPLIVKLHGSVLDRKQLAITIRRIARQEHLQSTRSVINHIFSTGSHGLVLILGYSCSDVFDISPQIASIRDKQKRVILIEHDKGNKKGSVESIIVKEKKNPFKDFVNGIRVYIDTEVIINVLWDRCLSDRYNSESRISSGESWIDHVDTWFAQMSPRIEGIIKNNIAGNAFLLLSDMVSIGIARKCYENAVREAEKIDHKQGWAANTANLGWTYYLSGDHDRAIELGESALEISRGIQDWPGVIRALGILGGTYLMRGGTGRTSYEQQSATKAKGYCEEAIQYCRVEGNKIYEAMVRSILGGIHYVLGEYDNALKELFTSTDIAKSTGEPGVEVSALLMTGRVQTACREFTAAISSLDRALEIANNFGNRAGAGATLAYLGEVYGSMGKRDRARTCYADALEILSDVFPKEHPWLDVLRKRKSM